MEENREVKNDVFVMLMEEKAYALQVYNALSGAHYTDPELVELQRLSRGIALTIQNDAAFIVDMNLHLYEHQSTLNYNMPLRTLFYVADTLKRYVKKNGYNLYGSRRIMLPTPHIVVFYNGLSSCPEKETMRLSDSYVHSNLKPNLELFCTVYNINPGQNELLKQDCKVLSDYTTLIEKIREYEDEGNEKPIEDAIDFCIDHGILSEFLLSRRDEVIRSMILDMTFEAREKMTRRDALEEGRQEGRVEEKKTIVLRMHQRGYTDEEIAQLIEVSIEEVRNWCESSTC